MNRKKLSVLFITMALLALPSKLFSNGQSENDGKVVLHVLAGQSTTDAGIEVYIDELLEEACPDIKLEWDIVGWGTDFQAKMQVAISSDNLPDIMIGKAQDITTWGSQGLLANLDGKPYLNYLLPEAIESGTYNGEVNGVIFNALYQGVYYNKEIFKKYNLEIPTTLDELDVIVQKLQANGVTPFETHFADTWSIGNMTMQFAINDLFNKTPDWGDQFRANKQSYASSDIWEKIYGYNKYLLENSWSEETFSLQQNMADAKMVQGEAAMKVSGSWSIQNFLDVDPDFDFGVFPFPNQTGDARLIYEPNITYMAVKNSPHQAEIDRVMEAILSSKEVAIQLYDMTKTAPMLKDVTPTFKNPSQADIDKFVAAGQIVDAGTGNNQLVWGGFQDENALDIIEWLLGDATLDDALKAADSRRANSRP